MLSWYPRLMEDRTSGLLTFLATALAMEPALVTAEDIMTGFSVDVLYCVAMLLNDGGSSKMMMMQ